MTRRLCLITALAVFGCSDYGVNQNTKYGHTPNDPSGAPSDDVSDWTPPDDTDDTDVDGDDYETEREETDTVDRVVQPAEFSVDVLWVVDNSCSMEDDQGSLVTNFPTFIDTFLAMEGLDYHVGVVSTDVFDSNHQGRLRRADGVKWLDVDTPDPYGTFDSMARMGTGGSGDECGRAAAYHALDTHLDGFNADFIREDAALSVIVISDEEDSSDIVGIEMEPFISFMEGFKYDPAMLSFSAIAGPTPSGCSTADPGWGYDEAVTRLGGVFHSICDADWAAVLDELANNAASLRREFFLAEIPIEDTITVWVIEEDGTRVDLVLGTDFTYDAARNSVQLLSYTPGPYAEVFIGYDVDWGAS
jgi:hypothetical protein